MVGVGEFRTVANFKKLFIIFLRHRVPITVLCFGLRSSLHFHLFFFNWVGCQLSSKLRELMSWLLSVHAAASFTIIMYLFVNISQPGNDLREVAWPPSPPPCAPGTPQGRRACHRGSTPKCGRRNRLQLSGGSQGCGQDTLSQETPKVQYKHDWKQGYLEIYEL